MMKKVLMVALIALFALGVTSAAQATVLAPGGFGTITPAGLPGGSVFVSGANTSFAFATVSGDIQQDIYLNSTGYVFVYRLHNSSSSTNAIGRMTATNFTGFYTEVDGYLVAAGDDQPHGSNRSLAGDTVGFTFENSATLDAGLMPGKYSYALWVQTDAKFIGPGQIHLINGGTHDIDVLGPTVPEPASAALLGIGLIGLVGALRRKFMA